MAGIGTRDVALLALFSPWDARPAIVCLGLFCTTRYVVMALLGVPAVVSLGSTIGSIVRSRQGPSDPSQPPSAESLPHGTPRDSA